MYLLEAFNVSTKSQIILTLDPVPTTCSDHLRNVNNNPFTRTMDTMDSNNIIGCRGIHVHVT